MERNVFKANSPEQDVKIHNTLARLEHKGDNGTILKQKVRLCAKGDQQDEGMSFKSSDLYLPTLKAPEARLLAALQQNRSGTETPLFPWISRNRQTTLVIIKKMIRSF